MNKKQRIVVILFILVILVTLIFPPSDNRDSDRSLGNSRDSNKFRGAVYTSTEFYPFWDNNGIDYTSLFLQDIVILIMFSAIYLLFSDGR